MARSIGAQSASIRTATLPPGDSYEQAFGALDQPFVVDLRALPAHSPAAVWFNTPRPFRAVASHYDEANRATHFTAVALPRSFDAVAFVN